MSESDVFVSRGPQRPFLLWDLAAGVHQSDGTAPLRGRLRCNDISVL